MMFNKNLKNILLVIFATLILSACSTAKKSGNIDGDVYTGKETVEYLASGFLIEYFLQLINLHLQQLQERL